MKVWWPENGWLGIFGSALAWGTAEEVARTWNEETLEQRLSASNAMRKLPVGQEINRRLAFFEKKGIKVVSTRPMSRDVAVRTLGLREQDEALKVVAVLMEA